jgi:hypothetical protein
MTHTRQQLADHLGIDVSTVRRGIENGRLEGAVDATGRVIPDLELAAAKWAETRGGADRQHGANAQHITPDPTIAQARRRKNLALATKARDDLAQLRAGLHSPAEAQMVISQDLVPALARLRQVADRAAPVVAGRPADEAEVALDDAVQAALVDIQAELAASPPPSSRPGAKAEPNLERMTNAGLEAMKVQYAAIRLELEAALERGELVTTASVVAGLSDQLQAVRQNLMQLPGRCAQDCEAAPDEAAARACIAAAMEEALEPLGQTALAAPPPGTPVAEAMRAKWKDPIFRRHMSERIRAGMARRKANARRT